MRVKWSRERIVAALQEWQHAALKAAGVDQGEMSPKAIPEELQTISSSILGHKRNNTPRATKKGHNRCRVKPSSAASSSGKCRSAG
jgi:hypothetical protein